MDLFHQTVSMKSVGNLTDFVRGHMLEAFPVEARIGALIAHFDDLNRAHQAVLKARTQIGQLTPLTADWARNAGLLGNASRASWPAGPAAARQARPCAATRRGHAGDSCQRR